MFSILNDRLKIKKLDSQDMLSSIEMYPEQIKSVLSDYKKIKLPKWKDIKNILVAGMGGSALATDIVRSLYGNKLRVPIGIANNYYLPGWVTEDTLCVIISYSGNTEETLTALEEAKKRRAMIFIITSGGKLAQIAQQENIPAHIFNGALNPSKSPRIGLNFTLFSQLCLFKELDLLSLKNNDLQEIISYLEHKMKIFSVNNEKNPAKDLAFSLKGFIPVLAGSDFLSGFLHTFANQIHENAKSFAVYFPLPELNHHLMEGLTFPKNKNILKFLLIESDLYYPKNRIRYSIMKKVLKRNKIKYIDYKCLGKDISEQSMEILMLASWSSFYLGMLYKVDPALIPNVDFFKAEMAKIS